jgi:methionyl-tRNA formyltransferase
MTIVLYTRRNVGLIALSYLVAKGHNVKVIPDDKNILWLADRLGCKIIEFDGDWEEFDLFLCVHGRKIIPKEKLIPGKFVNIHPCLKEGFKGHNPVERFLKTGADTASISSHYMTEQVDEGKIIETVIFNTENVKTYADFYNEAFKYYFFLLSNTLNKII